MASTLFSFRAEKGTRTLDLLITNELLYQLSYFGNPGFVKWCKDRYSFDMWCGKVSIFFSVYLAVTLASVM